MRFFCFLLLLCRRSLRLVGCNRCSGLVLLPARYHAAAASFPWTSRGLRFEEHSPGGNLAACQTGRCQNIGKLQQPCEFLVPISFSICCWLFGDALLWHRDDRAFFAYIPWNWLCMGQPCSKYLPGMLAVSASSGARPIRVSFPIESLHILVMRELLNSIEFTGPWCGMESFL